MFLSSCVSTEPPAFMIASSKSSCVHKLNKTGCLAVILEMFQWLLVLIFSIVSFVVPINFEIWLFFTSYCLDLSASLTFCIITPLAFWAATLPNSIGGNSLIINSPKFILVSIG